MSKNQNLLLRKLQRHNRVSTLFRTTDDPLSGMAAQENSFVENKAGSPSSLTATKAGLLPPDSQLPRGYFLNGPLPQALSTNLPQATPAPDPSQPDPFQLDGPSSEVVRDPLTQKFTPAQQAPSEGINIPPSLPAASGSRAPVIQRQIDPVSPSINPAAASASPRLAPASVPTPVKTNQPQAVPPSSNPSKEESKFTQKELDRLQAIFDLHAQTAQEAPDAPEVDGQAAQVTPVPAGAAKSGSEPTAAKPGAIQRTPDPDPDQTIVARPGRTASPSPSEFDSSDRGSAIQQPANQPALASTRQAAISTVRDNNPPSDQTTPNPERLQRANPIPANASPLSADTTNWAEKGTEVPPVSPSLATTGFTGLSPQAVASNALPDNAVSQPVERKPAANQGKPGLIQRQPDPAAAPVHERQAAVPLFQQPEKETPPHEIDSDLLQSQPLETVWNVERRATVPPSSGLKSNPTLPLEAPPVPVNVQRVLSETTPGQPTDSRVETLAPRMPRPVLPARPADRERIQRTPEEPAAPKPPSVEAEIVDSAVGPLPADLWRLIGEQPPARPSESSKVAAIPAAPAQNHSAKMMEMASPKSLESSDAGSSSQISLSEKAVPSPSAGKPLIQRTAEESPSEASSGSAASQGSAASEQQANHPPELDMEDLSVKVYAEVKRRLSIEWDRLRNRF